MGFDDALNKAKDYASDNPDKVDQGLDSASEKVKGRTPDNIDEHVDTGTDAARDRLGGDQSEGGSADQQGR